MKKVNVWTDGASRGNPGPSSFGSICEVDGKLVYEESFEIGKKTNNAAEYSGLIYSLSKLIALELECENVTVKSDSQLMVRQISGEYKVKTKELMEYYLVAKNLISRFKKIEIIHVGRNDNKSADRMANLAFDK
ncbi:MAG TPA: ribonuclease HI family protein [Caldisericia bacterium]|nr:ribonuclease HI family protein [Caldisericia bacterium]HPF49034.1 ribonuclease HI family protein [Caldisericia bacterium]HPI83102.1 ribonuclease HI family protein [Caldisericia bacterium]HPQ92329.1 ribonuclease HI family protein [Caldisericia bacterium]HRV74573.1 ribonuclease HI family protein [Caldisericia bacterium]